MKTKSVKQKEKQKHELIFKYLKNLTPFAPNPETDNYLQQLRKVKAKDHEATCLLSSKVYDINIAAVQSSRKRVSFLQVEKESKVSTTKKKRQRRSKSDALLSQNGQQQKQTVKFSSQTVQNDLVQLQKSVFSTFKIRPEESRHSNYNLSAKMQQVEPKDSDLKGSTLLESKIIRAKSASTFSHLKLQSQVKQPQPKSSLNLKESASSSGLSRSQSFQTSKLSSSQLSQQYSRSSIYSQQSHNLMVEIFKHKLKTKFPS